MSNDPAKYRVLIKQYLFSNLDNSTSEIIPAVPRAACQGQLMASAYIYKEGSEPGLEVAKYRRQTDPNGGYGQN